MIILKKVEVVGRDGVRTVRCRSAMMEPPALVLTSSHLQAIQEAAKQVRNSLINIQIFLKIPSVYKLMFAQQNGVIIIGIILQL